MTDQLNSGPGDDRQGTARPGQDRLESLVCSLIELKSNILLIEQQHEALGNDLSALCDLVLEHLTRVDDSPPLRESRAIPPPQQIEHQAEPSPAAAIAPALPDIPVNPTIEKSESPVARAKLANAIFDAIGDGLITGLDKAGDGVIFAFEKILSLGNREKKDSTEDAA